MTAAGPSAAVEVDVLGLFQPQTLIVHPADAPPVRVENGAPPFAHRGDFTLEVPGRFRRRYQGALRIVTVEDRLQATVMMSEREYLARVVAAEMNHASPAALEAQVIAARSYLRAAGRRHSGARVCDTTHCQWVADRP
ncbi:MAG: SpoIID/LytB domain-containing protein, partial [Acidobacteriota bacterium]